MEETRQDGIPITVVVGPYELLNVSLLFALLPELLPGTTPVVHLARFPSLFQGTAVGPCEHEHVVGPDVLRDDGDQSHRILIAS